MLVVLVSSSFVYTAVVRICKKYFFCMQKIDFLQAEVRRQDRAPVGPSNYLVVSLLLSFVAARLLNRCSRWAFCTQRKEFDAGVKFRIPAVCYLLLLPKCRYSRNGRCCFVAYTPEA